MRGLFGGGPRFSINKLFPPRLSPDEVFPRTNSKTLPASLSESTICSLGPSKLKLNSILLSPAKTSSIRLLISNGLPPKLVIFDQGATHRSDPAGFFVFYVLESEILDHDNLVLVIFGGFDQGSASWFSICIDPVWRIEFHSGFGIKPFVLDCRVRVLKRKARYWKNLSF